MVWNFSFENVNHKVDSGNCLSRSITLKYCYYLVQENVKRGRSVATSPMWHLVCMYHSHYFAIRSNFSLSKLCALAFSFLPMEFSMSPWIWEAEKDEAGRAVCPGCIYMCCWCHIDSAPRQPLTFSHLELMHMSIMCRTHMNFWSGLGNEQVLHVILIYQQIPTFQWL